MSINAEIIADSKNSCGNRLTTFILEYPRFIHSELMTHRMFSKNAASSRAIPIEKMIQQIIDNPAMPEFWGKNQSGMQANEELDDVEKSIEVFTDIYDEKNNDWIIEKITPRENAKIIWLEARDKAIEFAQALNKLGLHKQICNRILECWFNIRIILSGTEFENFFALRAHKDAQPELQKLAFLMLEQYNKSEPKLLKESQYHIPFGDKIDNEKIFRTESWQEETSGCAFGLSKDIDGYLLDFKKKIAIARCARISYFNYEGKDDYEADIKLCDRLFGSNPKHLSPTEHVAMALDKPERIGNYVGFKQYRYFFNEQNLTDTRVIKK